MYTTGQIVLINKGEKNNINLTSAPFKILQVDISINKANKNYLDIYMQTDDTMGAWWGFFVINDTSKTNQIMERTLYFKVLPKRKYRLDRTLCNRTGLLTHEYVYKDCESILNQSFYVDYVDTTKIEIK
jgi:hypothetical protein